MTEDSGDLMYLRTSLSRATRYGIWVLAKSEIELVVEMKMEGSPS